MKENSAIGFGKIEPEKLKADGSYWMIDLGIDRIKLIPLAEINYFELYNDCEISEELKQLIEEEGFEIIKNENKEDYKCYSRKK